MQGSLLSLDNVSSHAGLYRLSLNNVSSHAGPICYL